MIAHKTGKRVGLDTSTRMASDAIFAYSHLEPSVSSPARPNPELDPLDELGRFVSEDPRSDNAFSSSARKPISRHIRRGRMRLRRLDCDARSGPYALLAACDRISANSATRRRAKGYSSLQSGEGDSVLPFADRLSAGAGAVCKQL